MAYYGNPFREGTAAYDLAEDTLAAEAMGEVSGDQLPCPQDECLGCVFFEDCEVKNVPWRQFGRKRYPEWSTE